MYEAYYKFQGDLNDHSGNARTAAKYGAGNLTYPIGGWGLCARSTTSSMIQLPSSVAWNNGAWTLSGLVCKEGDASLLSLYYDWNLSPNKRFGLTYLDTEGLSASVGKVEQKYSAPASSASIAPINKWHHFVITVPNNVTDPCLIYANGVLVGTNGWVNNSNVGNTANQRLCLGSNYNSVDSFYDGNKISRLIIEKRIWSAQEIKTRYCSLKGHF